MVFEVCFLLSFVIFQEHKLSVDVYASVAGFSIVLFFF